LQCVKKEMLGWLGYGNKPEDTSHVTEAVQDAGVTLQELETKQRQLRKRAEKLQQEAMEADENGDEVTRNARVEEWESLQGDIAHYGVLIENTRATRAALDSVAANASVFQTQRQAVVALETANKQMSVSDVDRTHEQLERHMDNSHQFSRVMGARLRKPIRKPSGAGNARDAAVQETMAKWRTQKMPTAPKGVPTGTVGAAAPTVPVAKGKEELNGK
jgi:hypothetical protein